jgi:hypothetical protein
MAKTRVSATDLVWIFQERLQSSGDCSLGTSIAIVPSTDGWVVVSKARQRENSPGCVKRIEKLQKELRDLYVLAKD